MRPIPPAARRPVILPAWLRGPFGSLLGADLSQVRLHLDSPAAVALGARAFASGDEIHLAPGAYDPFSSEGWSTLGHELAHVIQQRCGRVPDRDGRTPFHDLRLEHEADLAGRDAAAMYESASLPSRPLFGGRIPSRHKGACAVQCLMDVKAFETATDAPGIRDKIKAVDAALKQFHKLNKAVEAARTQYVNDRTKQQRPDYGPLRKQIIAMLQACRTYIEKRPDSKRLPGVRNLMKQIDPEEDLLAALAGYSRENDPLRQFEALELAQERYLEFRGRPDFTRYTKSNGYTVPETEVIELISTHQNVMKAAKIEPDVVRREIDELRKLADLSTLPEILRSIIIECTDAGNVRQLDMKLFLPGCVYNTTNGATQKYTLKHITEQHLGKKLRMGSLLHELTHVSIAETFDNTVVMLTIKKTATDEEMLALARERNMNIARLQGLIANDPNLNHELRDECKEKAQYAVGNKFDTYLIAFQKFLGPDFARLKGLTRQGMKSELVEYDTVINQMALWCCLWDMPKTAPVYAELLSLAKAAFEYRAVHRHAVPLPLTITILPRRERSGSETSDIKFEI